MMVNKSTNINKTNNHLSSYHTENKKGGGGATYDIYNPGNGSVKPVNGIPTIFSLITGSPTATPAVNRLLDIGR